MRTCTDRQKSPKLRNDINAYIERGEKTIERMDTSERRMHDDRNRKSQDAIQRILVMLSLFSFSGVVALFITLWYGSTVPAADSHIQAHKESHSAGVWDLIIVATVYGAVLILTWLFLWSSIRSSRARRRR